MPGTVTFSTSSVRRPRGFTLIELMAVLVIITMMFGFLMPLVVQARDRARRLQCQNHLMQIGLALNNYANTHGVLPPGTSNATGPIISKENVASYHMSWIVQILPFLEQSAAFQHIDFSSSVYSPENLPIRERTVAILLCPSDSGRMWGSTSAGITNYCGIHNDVEAPIDVNQNGVLFLNSAIRHDQITDGGSNTIFVGEVMSQRGTELGWMAGTRSTLRNAVIQTGTSEASQTVGYKRHPFPISAPGGVIYPGNTIRDEPNSPTDGTEFVGGFSSAHTSGFQVVFGDGCVRHLSTNIDALLFRNLAHRADGEMLDEF